MFHIRLRCSDLVALLSLLLLELKDVDENAVSVSCEVYCLFACAPTCAGCCCTRSKSLSMSPR